MQYLHPFFGRVCNVYIYEYQALFIFKFRVVRDRADNPLGTAAVSKVRDDQQRIMEAAPCTYSIMNSIRGGIDTRFADAYMCMCTGRWMGT